MRLRNFLKALPAVVFGAAIGQVRDLSLPDIAPYVSRLDNIRISSNTITAIGEGAVCCGIYFDGSAKVVSPRFHDWVIGNNVVIEHPWRWVPTVMG